MSARLSLLLLLLAGVALADPGIDYQLRYTTAAPGAVRVALLLAPGVRAPADLVLPRTYPGGYAQLPYDEFVSRVVARGADGRPLAVARDADGPRWRLGAAGDTVASVEYVVDLRRMELAIPDAVSTSKRRPGYVGLLGYSVFGYVDGCAGRPLRLHVEAPPGWPVLSTLHPQLPVATGTTDAVAGDFYELADSEVLLGPRFSLEKLAGDIGLYVAIYAEGEVDRALEARLAREALDRVSAWFGDAPIHDYTVQLELLRPLPGHQYGFSQEHVASGTFSLAVDGALTARSSARDRDRVEFNFAHHMAHSWIPKRAYGEGYRPFNWEMAPVIDTIWFNEGFGRYAAIAAMAAALPAAEGRAYRESRLAALRQVLADAPPFIRCMPLAVLSREASFLYAADFRTGRNVFARGALMAAEMDVRIKAGSGGSASLRDALRWLLDWSDRHRAPFATGDLAGYFATATGVSVADILDRWQQPLETP
jgi:predicted metalloprotease with PDZ domain